MKTKYKFQREFGIINNTHSFTFSICVLSAHGDYSNFQINFLTGTYDTFSGMCCILYV